jgi:hypothetical protein
MILLTIEWLLFLLFHVLDTACHCSSFSRTCAVLARQVELWLHVLPVFFVKFPAIFVQYIYIYHREVYGPRSEVERAQAWMRTVSRPIRSGSRNRVTSS